MTAWLALIPLAVLGLLFVPWLGVRVYDGVRCWLRHRNDPDITVSYPDGRRESFYRDGRVEHGRWQ